MKKLSLFIKHHVKAELALWFHNNRVELKTDKCNFSKIFILSIPYV